jgi:hypothetical protein
MPDARPRCCHTCSKPIADADPVRVESGRAHHLGCWWRQRHLAELEVVEAAAARARALRIEAQQAVLAAHGQRARRFTAARPRPGGSDPCAVCGEAIRTGAPGYRTDERRYHVACWERPTPLASWLLLGAAHAEPRRDAPPGRRGWENPRTPTGDPICVLCGEAIEVAQPVVHLQGWLAHGLCWEPPMPLAWPGPEREARGGPPGPRRPTA